MNGITYNNNFKKFEQRSTNGLLIDEGKDQQNKVSNKYSTTTSPSLASTTELNNYQELIIRSIKEAVNFTMNNNLFGLITSIHLLDLVPKLIPLIRSRGLILVASSDTNDQDDAEEEVLKRELDSYTKTEINGLRFDDVLSFKQDITM